MTAHIPEIECRQCRGHGTVLSFGRIDDAETCPCCNGQGWRPMTPDELDAAAEKQAEDRMSEPSMSLDEQHRRAWDLKQELHRR